MGGHQQRRRHPSEVPKQTGGERNQEIEEGPPAVGSKRFIFSDATLGSDEGVGKFVDDNKSEGRFASGAL